MTRAIFLQYFELLADGGPRTAPRPQHFATTKALKGADALGTCHALRPGTGRGPFTL